MSDFTMGSKSTFNQRRKDKFTRNKNRFRHIGACRYTEMAKEAQKANEEDITGKRLVWSDEENKMVWR